MKKKKKTLLELGRVPTLEELRAFFRENDFSTAAYMDMDYDKLDAGTVETLEQIKGLMDEQWEPLSREMGLKRIPQITARTIPSSPCGTAWKISWRAAF